MSKRSEIINRIQKEIDRYDSNDFKIMFYVPDTKGKPNATLTYVYELALWLSKKNYNVVMLHSENEFVGVEEWLGEEYAKLKHFCVDGGKLEVSSSDFLFIPEMFSSVMNQVKNIKCKKIILFTNYDYLFDTILPGATLEQYNIYDCLCISKGLAKRFSELFPNINVSVLPPFINDNFFFESKTKKPYINILSKNPLISKIIAKQFFLKHPIYKWIGFRDISGVPRTDLANLLKDSFATIWVDERTDFGYSAMESMASNNVGIYKVPSDDVDWAFDDGRLNDCAIWFYNEKDISDILASVIQTYLSDKLPKDLFDNMKNVTKKYSYSVFEKNAEKVIIENYINARKKEMEQAIILAKNNKDLED